MSSPERQETSKASQAQPPETPKQPPERQDTSKASQAQPPETPKQPLTPRQQELHALTQSITNKRKKLRPKRSFDKPYWYTARDILQDEIKRNELHLKNALEAFILSGAPGNWKNDPTVRSIYADRQRLLYKERQFKKHMERLAGDGDDIDATFQRRAFFEQFTASRLGLDIVAGAGKRDPSDQSNFRESMIKAYACKDPDRERLHLDDHWCPIISEWVHKFDVKAGHLFSYKHGQDTMTAIFGQTEEPELFHPRNGLIMFDRVEDMFDCGFFVIAPDIPNDNPTADEIRRWQTTHPREYKLHILDMNHPTASKPVGTIRNIYWKDLHGKRLEFRSDARPRARYLYFHYLTQILRYAWHERFKGEILRERGMEKKVWATPGRYSKRSSIRAFIEEVGHEYEHLFWEPEEEGGPQEKDDFDECLLQACVDQVEYNLRKKTPGDDDDDDSDEEEDEDEGDDEGEGETAGPSHAHGHSATNPDGSTLSN
ncbi:hypothetical protein FQN50_009848 [Emmonsiellopsis sp. PD_5]|nr:hypothetical protein FQN50_009848 [Emmonsiellopsis sp. PD_5]